MIAGGLLAFFLLKGGDDKKTASSSDPAATVKAYLQAVKDDDPKAATKLSCPGSPAYSNAATTTPGNDDRDRINGYTVGKAKINGSNATVPTTIQFASGGSDDSSADLNFKTQKVDGKWLVCDVGDGDSGDETDDEGGSTVHGPSISIPSFSLPSFSLPSFSFPSFSFPSFTFPSLAPGN